MNSLAISYYAKQHAIWDASMPPGPDKTQHSYSAGYSEFAFNNQFVLPQVATAGLSYPINGFSNASRTRQRDIVSLAGNSTGNVHGYFNLSNRLNYWHSNQPFKVEFSVPKPLAQLTGYGAVEFQLNLELGSTEPFTTTLGSETTISWNIDFGQAFSQVVLSTNYIRNVSGWHKTLIMAGIAYLSKNMGSVRLWITWDEIRQSNGVSEMDMTMVGQLNIFRPKMTLGYKFVWPKDDVVESEDHGFLMV